MWPPLAKLHALISKRAARPAVVATASAAAAEKPAMNKIRGTLESIFTFLVDSYILFF